MKSRCSLSTAHCQGRGEFFFTLHLCWAHRGRVTGSERDGTHSSTTTTPWTRKISPRRRESTHKGKDVSIDVISGYRELSVSTISWGVVAVANKKKGKAGEDSAWARDRRGGNRERPFPARQTLMVKSCSMPGVTLAMNWTWCVWSARVIHQNTRGERPGAHTLRNTTKY